MTARNLNSSAGARINHCSLITNSTLYIFGGKSFLPSTASSNASLPLFASLDLASRLSSNSSRSGWQTLPSSGAVPVLNPQCVSTETHLLVIGGQPIDETELFKDPKDMDFYGLQAYNYVERTWANLMPNEAITRPYITLNRTGHTAEWFSDIYGKGSGGGLFVMGGLAYNSTLPGNDAFVYFPFQIPTSSDTTATSNIGVTSLAQILPPPTIDSGTAKLVNSTSLLLFGGKAVLSGEEQPTTIWEFTPQNNNWKTFDNLKLNSPIPNTAGRGVVVGNDLMIIDLTPGSKSDGAFIVDLTGADLQKRSEGPRDPIHMEGYSVAFDADMGVGVVSGGDGSSSNVLQVFNTTSKEWSQLVLSSPQPISTASSSSMLQPSLSSTSSIALQTPTSSAVAPPSVSNPQSTSFSKSNVLIPIIVGSIVGFLGVIGLVLLCIYYQRKRAIKAARDRKSGRVSRSPAAMWLKYGSRRSIRQQNPKGETFIRELEDKHFPFRNSNIIMPNSRIKRTGWSKYFSTSWYTTRSRASDMDRSLVQFHSSQHAMNDDDGASQYSKASSFVSDYSVGTGTGGMALGVGYSKPGGGDRGYGGMSSLNSFSGGAGRVNVTGGFGSKMQSDNFLTVGEDGRRTNFGAGGVRRL